MRAMEGRDYSKRGDTPRNSNPCSSQFSFMEPKAHSKGSSIDAWGLSKIGFFKTEKLNPSLPTSYLVYVQSLHA